MKLAKVPLGAWAAEGKSLTADGMGDALMRHGRELPNYLPYEPDQMLLLSESLQEWLPEGHLAHFISDAVDGVDLGAFYARYDKDGPRNQPFHPAMMVKVLVYGYATGVFSSRKIARKLHEDVAFRVLAARNFHAHRTLRLPLKSGVHSSVVKRQISAAPPTSVVRTASG